MSEPVIEIRRNDNGTLDEIVANGVHVHLEQMDSKTWWLCVSKGKGRVALYFTSRSKIQTCVSEGG